MAMVLMDVLSDEEEFSVTNDPSKAGNYASHHAAGDSSSIILHPFAHQVGGHTQLLTFDKSTLCKPLIPRELLFYLNVPKELVNFVPTYKGVVQIRETGQGTYPPVVYQPLRSPKSPYAKYRPHHGTTNLHAGYHSEDDDDSSQQSVTETCGFPLALEVQIRPFSDEKVLKKNLSQDNLLRADYISRPNERYLLLLENVASKYQLPCILDLKMGTRQHGDDATEEKRHRQMAKCQASTSASLGVRLCGMQVYQVDYGGFLWYDKYYGRKMDKGGLKRALHEYFRNGSQLNEDIIDDVISRLKLLSNAVERSPSFRFYGTSLLIIHEGCASSSKRCPVEVRLIDFAHTICDYSSTNGRSSSSPSVLTKSSSAEQLTTTSTNTTTAAATAASTVPVIPSIATSGASQQEPAKSQAVSGQLNDDKHGEQRDELNSNSNQPLKSLQGASPVNVVSDVHDDTENRFPRPPLSLFDSATGPAATATISSEHNNNNNSIAIANDNSNGSKDNIATSFKTSTNCKRQSQYKPSYQNTLETLREVDHQAQPDLSAASAGASLTKTKLSSSNIIDPTTASLPTQQQQPPPTLPPPPPTTSTQATAPTATTETSAKQVSSTPSTPPSLGSRKTSRTSMGPDKGLLFGLENLMRLLDDLKSETLITTC